LHGCSYHVQDDRSWIALPGKPQLDRDGQHRKDPATGKGLWTPVVEIPDKSTRARFQAMAVTAVHAMIEDAPAQRHPCQPRPPPNAYGARRRAPLPAGGGPELPSDPVADLWQDDAR
jgi:hypothetical protein